MDKNKWIEEKVSILVSFLWELENSSKTVITLPERERLKFFLRQSLEEAWDKGLQDNESAQRLIFGGAG